MMGEGPWEGCKEKVVREWVKEKDDGKQVGGAAIGTYDNFLSVNPYIDITKLSESWIRGKASQDMGWLRVVGSLKL